MASNASTQINAVQVRDVTNIGYWAGTSFSGTTATWDASTTSDFATNAYTAPITYGTFATAKATLNSVTFSDTAWNSGTVTTVTQNNITIGPAVFPPATFIYEYRRPIHYHQL